MNDVHWCYIKSNIAADISGKSIISSCRSYDRFLNSRMIFCPFLLLIIKLTNCSCAGPHLTFSCGNSWRRLVARLKSNRNVIRETESARAMQPNNFPFACKNVCDVLLLELGVPDPTKKVLLRPLYFWNTI
jgi:hypothetical protein